MGLLQTIHFAFQRVRGKPAARCTHLDQIHDVQPQSTGCQACLDQGDTWVHLRMCLTDGLVLCCDSSKNKHASRHAREHAPEHQIVRSMEPEEDWLWCYTDEMLVQAPDAKGKVRTSGTG
jgi:Zn-finger in ubiquitin-hydrolases and other protein